MARLDFNQLNTPVLDMTMADEEKTRITVTTPTEGLVEALEAMMPQANAIFAENNPDMLDACYDLAARVMSCNRQGIQVSIDDLKKKYWPTDRVANQVHLLTFFKAYMDYIEEIKNAKN
jgi:hypothetical protein